MTVRIWVPCWKRNEWLYLQSASQFGGHLFDGTVQPSASSLGHDNRLTRMDLVLLQPYTSEKCPYVEHRLYLDQLYCLLVDLSRVLIDVFSSKVSSKMGACAHRGVLFIGCWCHVVPSF